jgi:hypothetical protein
MSSPDETEILQSVSCSRDQAFALQACALELRENGWKRAVRWRIAAMLERLADDLDPRPTNYS